MLLYCWKRNFLEDFVEAVQCKGVIFFKKKKFVTLHTYILAAAIFQNPHPYVCESSHSHM